MLTAGLSNNHAVHEVRPKAHCEPQDNLKFTHWVKPSLRTLFSYQICVFQDLHIT